MCLSFSVPTNVFDATQLVPKEMFMEKRRESGSGGGEAGEAGGEGGWEGGEAAYCPPPWMRTQKPASGTKCSRDSQSPRTPCTHVAQSFPHTGAWKIPTSAVANYVTGQKGRRKRVSSLPLAELPLFPGLRLRGRVLLQTKLLL